MTSVIAHPLSVLVPRYVLRAGTKRIGPAMAESTMVSATYAFTDKRAYDLFSAGNEVNATPYPLVKQFLRDVINNENGILQLAVIDAPSPDDSLLFAVPLTTLLEAMQASLQQVGITHHLARDNNAPVYNILEVSKPAT